MSTNISKEKREELLREVAEIRSKLLENKDENTEKLLVYLSNIEKDINGKKYGLVFEEHREAVDELLENNVPVLIEDEGLKIDNGGQQNFLIEGDNLASLKLLEKTHKGKIDFIYIDPPYNTGNKDFVYDDAFVDSEDKFKHSKWLSFMKVRLEIAHRLLTHRGMIMISINDIELYNLKVLLDSVFGETNFLTNMIWQSTPGSNTGKTIKTVTEYVLVYAKDIKQNLVNTIKNYDDKKYDLFDEYEKERGKHILNKLDRRMTGSHYSEALNYPIQTPDGDRIYPGGELEKQKNWNWRWSSQKVQWGSKNGFIVFKKNKDKWSIYFKQYQFVDNNNNRIERFLPYQNLIKEDGVNSARGNQEVMDIFQSKAFDYPKPLNLIGYLLKISPFDKITILDFFAGSGTTGHAVMKLNAEDGGKRKFILCTNNENNICRDVTYERIKRVIAKEDYKASLKYYKVDFVPITEQVYYEYADKLLLHIKELVELENGLDFDGNNKVAICLTDEDLQEFTSAFTDATTYKAVYVGHDVFVTPEIESKLNSLGIKINIIPDYYYGELRG